MSGKARAAGIANGMVAWHHQTQRVSVRFSLTAVTGRQTLLFQHWNLAMINGPDKSYSADSGVCPTTEQWQSALRGDVNNVDWDDFESHLQSCPICELTVDALTEPSDTFVRELCAQPSNDDDEPAYRSLYANLIRDSRLAFQSESVELPFRLGNYKVHEALGSGANGSVFRATHVPLDRPVALKLLRPDYDFNPNQVDRFLKEIRAVARLDHPNLVRATDAGEADGRHFLAMEFVPGVDLSQVVATCEPLSVANACEVVRQTAIGVRHLHENGFVHRDLKPSNLLLTSGCVVKLLDLGLVQTITKQATTDGAPEKQTSTRWPDGTPDYMPPEQWNLKSADPRSDLYSLGCTLFKLLTGSPPYRPLPTGFEDRCAAHCRAAIPSLRELRPDVPVELDLIATRLLAKSPDLRFQSADELLTAISPLCQGANLEQVVTAVGMQPTTQATDDPPRISRRQALIAGAIGATALTVAVSRWHSRPKSTIDFGWRLLVPSNPPVLAAPLDLSSSRWKSSKENEYVISSNPPLLLNLGQPTLLRSYRLDVQIQKEDWPGSAGVFFRFHQPQGDRWQPDPEKPVHLYQTIELIQHSPADDCKLQWNACRTEKINGAWQTEKENLATTNVQVPSNRHNSALQLKMHETGFPVVSWCGTEIPFDQWKFTPAGFEQSSSEFEQPAARFAGRLGLIASGGEVTFRHPRLAYIDTASKS